MYVANNTFHVEGSESCSASPIKDIFINVGTLDSRKQNDVLILAFSKLIKVNKSNLYLYIIGEGSERSYLEDLIKTLNLEKNIFMPGRLEDINVLKKYYSRAIASVSFGQAGLAVLQSMALGVPFITKINAVSGGEKFNIINGFNGILCEDNINSLAEVMCQIANNLDYARNIGNNAFNYYTNHANIDVMVSGFQSAIEDNCDGSYLH